MSVEGHRVEGPRHGLRDLVEQATPGPWTWHSFDGYDAPDHPGELYSLEGLEAYLEGDREPFPARALSAHGEHTPGWVVASPSDARLIALAPDLALLLADAKDALTHMNESCGDDDCTYCNPDLSALLARIEELEGQA